MDDSQSTLDLETLSQIAKARNLHMSQRFLPYNPTLVERARQLRIMQTPQEKKLWFEYLRKAPVRFLRQRPIDHFIVDFYCPSHKLVIEVDGSYHFREEAQFAYDRFREDILELYGLRIIRFTNREIMQDFPACCNIIHQVIDQ
jgi:very-short-patch-repair endonuclease